MRSVRVLGAAALATLAALAVQAPAWAAIPLTDSAFTTNNTETYSYTVNGGWWNLVTSRGQTFDYDLTAKRPSGAALATSNIGSYFVDFVAVNANDACASNAGSGYQAVVNKFGSAPATPGDASPGDVLWRKGGGHVLGVVPKTSPDQFTVLQYSDQRDMALFDVFLQPNTTYRVAWNSVHGWFEGGVFLFTASDSAGSNCVRTRNTTTPVLWHSNENIGDATRSGEVRFTSTTGGWYGLLLMTQFFDLSQVSIGGGDSQPHLMIKPA